MRRQNAKEPLGILDLLHSNKKQHITANHSRICFLGNLRKTLCSNTHIIYEEGINE